MHYLGIDWAVEKHDVCLMTDDGRVLSQTIIPNNSHGFEQLNDLIADLDEVAVNIERGDGPIVEWLVAHAIPVYITPSALISHRRPRRSKDDRGDAFLLAQLLRMKEPECRPVIRQSETVLHLSLLIKGYDDVVQEVRRETTRLVWTLRQNIPTAVSAFQFAIHDVPRFPGSLSNS
jgi:transposase